MGSGHQKVPNPVISRRTSTFLEPVARAREHALPYYKLKLSFLISSRSSSPDSISGKLSLLMTIKGLNPAY